MITKEKLLEQIDTYDQSLLALLTFRQHLAFEFNAKSFIGRKLKTSKSNSIQSSIDITPDLITQFSDETGIVSEVKLSASTQENYSKVCEQMKKYDDNLTGWDTKTEKIKHSDLALIVRQGNAQELWDYFATQKKHKFDRRLAVISFNIDQLRNTFYVLERRGGALPDKLTVDFQRPVQVNSIYLVKDISQIKFYDGHPPVQYTMRILWDFIFSSLIPEEQYRESKGGKKIIELSVTLDGMVSELRKYGPEQGNERVPSLPKKDWVEEALKKFVEIGLAKFDSSVDTYTIKYHDVRKSKDQSSDFICEKIGDPQAKISDYIENQNNQKSDSDE